MAAASVTDDGFLSRQRSFRSFRRPRRPRLPRRSPSPTRRRRSMSPPPKFSELRVLLLGNSRPERSSVGNFIVGAHVFSTRDESDVCEKVTGRWKEMRVCVVNAPDLLHPKISDKKLKKQMEHCLKLTDPGPHVFLLVLQSEHFTEEHHVRLCRVMGLFSDPSFLHSLVLITREDAAAPVPPSLNGLMCKYSYLMLQGLDHMDLLDQMVQIAARNNGARVCGDSTSASPDVHRPTQLLSAAASKLQIVLWGKSETEKTNLRNFIIRDQARMSPEVWSPEVWSPEVWSSSECVKHQGDVCGRQVSLVQLPVLYGKPLEASMKESLSCVSLCDPEGVQAFVLVLPVGPLTDEDKGEFRTFQTLFGSRVHDFTLVLFTVDSGATAPAVADSEDLQELLQHCGGRYVAVNMKDKQQVTEVLDSVDKMRHNKSKAYSYTTETFTQVQMTRTVQLQAELETLKIQKMGDEDTRCLRIVLIGKSGSGKSMSGNTILGRREFRSDLCQTSITKHCQKAQSQVDGRPVVVVDTPGLFDTSLSHGEIYEEMVKCINLLAPGPHVFLLVVPIGRFTEEDKQTLSLIRKGFGKDSKQYTIVLLTRGDDLDKHRMSISEFIEKRCDVLFQKLIEECGGRYHVFNNYDQHNHTQVPQLIHKISNMLRENGGRCFTNEMLRESHTAIQEDMERILKENETMKREMEGLRRKHDAETRAMERTGGGEEESREAEEKLKEKLKEQLDEIKKKYEEEARRQSEAKCKDKYEEELQALKIQNAEEMKKLREDMKRKEEEHDEMKTERKLIEELDRAHKEEIRNLKKKYRKKCTIS